MKRILKLIVTTALVVVQSSCICIDALIPRKPRPIDRNFKVSLAYKGRKPIAKHIACEEYYDAMCAERGNYWAIRERGFEHEFQSSSISVDDSTVGHIEIFCPKPRYLVRGSNIFLNELGVDINGHPYSYVSTSGRLHTYQRIQPVQFPRKTIALEFELRIDGKLVKPSPRKANAKN